MSKHLRPIPIAAPKRRNVHLEVQATRTGSFAGPHRSSRSKVREFARGSSRKAKHRKAWREE